MNEPDNKEEPAPFVCVGTFLGCDLWVERADYKKLKDRFCVGKTRTHYGAEKHEVKIRGAN